MADRKTLDLDRVVNAINTLPVDKVGQLKGLVTDKMNEMGLKHRGRHARTATGETSTFNVRGVVDWVNNLKAPVNCCAVDKAEAEAKGEKYVHNHEAEARYNLESERFAEDCKKLQVLCATLHRRCGDAAHGT